MAASPKSFAGRGKTVHGTLRMLFGPISLVILTMLLGQGVPVMAGIFPLPSYSRLTARIGDDVKIPFEFCLQGIMPSCTLQLTFNLSAPNPLCNADHQHGDCQIEAAPEDHPGRPGLFNQVECELCELTVRGITQKDAGQYSICQLSACIWRNLSILEIENDVTQTSSTSASSGPVSTTPTPAPGVSTTKNTTTEDRPNISFDPRTTGKPNNDARTGMKISSAVGIPVTILIIVIVIVYLYKRRSRRRQLTQYYSHAASPSTNGTTTTVNINVNNADGCSIEIDGETAHFREDPEFNT